MLTYVVTCSIHCFFFWGSVVLNHLIYTTILLMAFVSCWILSLSYYRLVYCNIIGIVASPSIVMKLWTSPPRRPPSHSPGSLSQVLHLHRHLIFISSFLIDAPNSYQFLPWAWSISRRCFNPVLEKLNHDRTFDLSFYVALVHMHLIMEPSVYSLPFTNIIF